MWAYVIRKLLLMIPTMLGILLLTFVLFNVIAKDPAKVKAGKFKTDEQLQAIRHRMHLDIPRWINVQDMHERGIAGLFNSQFFRMLTFQFGESIQTNESVWALIGRKAPVSLAIQVPAFLIELGLQLVLALFVASRRGSSIDHTVTLLSVLGMSVPILSIYLGAQWLFGGYLRWFPVAGWGSGFFYAMHFAALPILVTIIGSLGSGTRFYRTVILEEIGSDYVRTARSKGVPGREVLLGHVLRNVMIPVVTNSIIVLPALIAGALLLERLFQVPGMGGLLVDAIHSQDFPVVSAFVYTTSLLYCVLLVVSDIAYTIVDPRITLK